MQVVGIICEYNPFHLGHRKQILRIREEFGPETAIVCAMSGNFVQRGAPALLDKSIRAKAALSSGADLILELPITAALSSAEGFALGGVKLLAPFCDCLCFGTESADGDVLWNTADTLLSPSFSRHLKEALETGISFPAARQLALESAGGQGSILRSPNNILGVEYCKAIRQLNCSMDIFPIHREGCYHADTPDANNPSATFVRKQMLLGGTWEPYVPAAAADAFSGAVLHSLEYGERAVLGCLRILPEDAFRTLPYGSEGLWRKLMHACHRENTLEDIVSATKSKRYTRTRLDRMILCAFLGITEEMLLLDVPYCRVLGFTDRGRSILNGTKKTVTLLNPGEKSDHPYFELEKRCGDLYGLFACGLPEPPGREENRRIIYHREKP